MNMKTFRIPEKNITKLTSQLEKLAKKSAKLGTLAIEWRITDEETEVLPNGKARKFFVVEISGETPKLNGWQFVGTIQAVEIETESGASKITGMVRNLPGAVIPREFENKFGVCEHCQTGRPRTQVYILQNADGFKIVGSTCLKDFTGHDNPFAVAQSCEYLLSALSECEGASDDGFYGMGESSSNRWSREFILDLCAALVRNAGFTSRAKASEDYTLRASADVLASFLFAKEGTESYKDLLPLFESADSDSETVENAIAWAKEGAESDNDFLYKLAMVATMPSYTVKEFGMACAMIACYNREQDKKRLAANELPSEWLGEVGEKIVFTATIMAIRAGQNDFGFYDWVTFKTQEGNVLTWKASNLPSGMEIGKEFTLQGTVKRHDTFNGKKQTVLTRCAEYVSPEEKKRRAKESREAAKKAA